MEKLFFCDELDSILTGSFEQYTLIDLSRRIEKKGEWIDLDKAILKNRDSYVNSIVSNLEKANNINDGVAWWAYTFTAKNPLSSPFILRSIDVLACIDIISQNSTVNFVIYKATASQKEAIRTGIYGYNDTGLLKKIQAFSYKCRTFLWSCKELYNIGKVFLDKPITSAKIDIGLMTYVDGADRSRGDQYFRQLITELKQSAPEKKIVYLFYVYVPLEERLEEAKGWEKNEYFPIYSFLRKDDFFWVARKTLFELFISRFTTRQMKNIFSFLLPVLIETISEDSGQGYINNLLLFKAGKRISQGSHLKNMIYPFENKSLEKCFLLGLGNNVNTIGYQHSSITPRHYSFLLTKEEVARIPLPGKIITTGSIPGAWLIDKGNFPKDKVLNGYSLRHTHGNQIAIKKFESSNAKLFLALSSSYNELLSGVIFLQQLKLMNPSLQIRVRNHVDFPLSHLPADLQQWISGYAEVLPGSNLHENFEWADITLYISSTVALESLMYNVPVIRLDIDILNSDPILSDISNRWTSDTPEKCLEKIREIAQLSIEKRETFAHEAIYYINSYFTPGNSASHMIFLNNTK